MNKRLYKRRKSSKWKKVIIILGFIAALLIVTAVIVIATENKSKNKQANNNENVVKDITSDTYSNETQKETETEAMTQTQKDTENSTQDAAEVMAGNTAKGYPIIRKNGVTYINGILIVNKTYALPASYNPQGLLSEVKEAFTKMQSAAKSEGLNIYISSAFRTYEYQKNLYERYVKKDGQEAADTYSARAGHSEHQSGLSFDLNSIDDSFAATPEGKWVAKHAHEYGFIIRFPEGKEDITGYKYESWHLRYVGTEVAKAMYESNQCLEEYLGITSLYD